MRQKSELPTDIQTAVKLSSSYEQLANWVSGPVKTQTTHSFKREGKMFSTTTRFKDDKETILKSKLPIAYQEMNSTMILEHSHSIQKLSQTTAQLEKRKRE